MVDLSDISPDRLQQLRRMAEDTGLTVDELLARLMDSHTSPHLPPGLPQRLLERTSDTISLFDTNLRYVYVNPVMGQLTGLDPADMIGKTDAELGMPPHLVERLHTAWQRVTETGEEGMVTFEFETAEGIQHFEARLTPIEANDGTLTHLLAVTRNVTPRVRAEQARARSEHLYRLLAEHSREAISLHRPDGRWIYANPYQVEMAGYSVEELFAMGPTELEQFVHPDDLQRTRDAAHAQTRRGETVTHLEYRFRRKDGSYVWVESDSVPIFNDEGEVEQILATTRNISERKAMVNRLLKYRSIIDNTTGGVALVNRDYRYELVNNAYLERTQLTREQVEGATVADVLGQSVFEMISKPHLDRALKGETCGYEHWFDYPVHGRRCVAVTYEPYHDEERDAITGVVVYSQDITERKQAEAAQRESEERLREVFATVPDILWSVDLTSAKMLYVSDAVETITGKPASFFYENTSYWLEIAHPDYLDRLSTGGKALIEQGEGTWEYPITRPDGTLRWLGVRGWLVKDETGHPRRLIGIAADITERRAMEQALSEAEQKYHLIAENTSDGFAIIDGTQQHITYASPAYDRLWGREPGTSVGRTQQDQYAAVHPEDAEDMYEQLHTTLEQRGEDVLLTYRARHENGHYFWKEDNIGIAYHEDDSYTLYVISRDITERKRAETLNREYARLKDRFQSEQEQSTLVQRVISMLNHDMRTPLAVIESARGLLDRYGDRLTDESRQEKLDSIRRQIRFATDLLDDTVNSIQGPLVEADFAPRPVHLPTLCEVSVHEIEAVAEQEHRIRFIDHERVGLVMVDDVLVSRILINLLTNAIKYSPGGGSIELELDRDGDELLLTVRDEGMGISDEDLPHIFNPLYRSRNVEGITGTGLGLSIVKACVERHQGTVAVESVLGEGSTFTVTLPHHAHDDELAGP